MRVLLISPAGTGGWKANEAGLTGSLAELGVEHEVRRVGLGRLERLRNPWASGAWFVAAAARRELARALAEGRPDAVIAVNSTAAMLFPFARLRELHVRTAIRIDCPAGAQFPGAAHALHRRREAWALAEADLALTMGPRSTASVEPLARRCAEVPLSVERRTPAAVAAPPALLTYAGQPKFKGLDLVLEAWAGLGAGRGEATLTVTGVEPEVARRYLRRQGIEDTEGVRWAGLLPRGEYDELLRGASAFISASRIEGYGLAQLEALAAGVPLVTTSSRGAYEAEPLARRLAPELCAEPQGLASAIAAALAMPPARRADYARRAGELLAPYARERVVPALADALDALAAGSAR